ncbi:MAG TPA: hypothetical protein VGL33_04915 [Streptosporangiaceae bacterium]
MQDTQPGDLVTALDEASLSRFHMRGGTLALTAGVAVLGFALTLVLPEPAGLSLDEIAAGSHKGYRARRVAPAPEGVPESGAA